MASRLKREFVGKLSLSVLGVANHCSQKGAEEAAEAEEWPEVLPAPPYRDIALSGLACSTTTVYSAASC